MNRVSLLFIPTSLLVVVLAAHAWAQQPPSIVSFTAIPRTLPVPGEKITLDLTTTVSDPQLVISKATVQRKQLDGSFKNIDKVGFKKTADPVVFVSKMGLRAEQDGGAIRLRLKVVFLKSVNLFSPVAVVGVGEPIDLSQNLNQETEVQGPAGSGLTLTFEPNSLTSPVIADIAFAPADVVEEQPQHPPRIATLDVIVQTEILSEIIVTESARITLPAPAGAEVGDRVFFAKPALGPKLGSQTGLEPKLIIIAEGFVVDIDGQLFIQSESSGGNGIFGGGVVGVLTDTGTGEVEGTVCDVTVVGCAAGLTPSRGTWVENVTNGFGHYTNAEGEYNIDIDGTFGTFEFEVVDVFRCAGATFSVNHTTADEIIIRNVSVQAQDSSTFAPRFDGIRNGGFELGGNPPCWTAVEQSSTAGQTVTVLDADSAVAHRDLFGLNVNLIISEGPGEDTKPPEGNSFLSLKPADSTKESIVEQPFLLPEGAETLRFEYVFACVDPACPGTDPNTATLTVELLDDTGQSLNPQRIVTNDHGGFGGQLGWRSGSIDVSTLTVGDEFILRFTAKNHEDGAVTLIDNIRFKTLFIDVTILDSVSTNLTRAVVEEQVRHAGEILSQTAFNVRARFIDDSVAPAYDHNCIAQNPPDLSVTDVSWGSPQALPPVVFPSTCPNESKFVRTLESRALLCIGPKERPDSPPPDVDVYYVENLLYVVDDQDQSNFAFGFAITSEDYHGPESNVDEDGDGCEDATILLNHEAGTAAGVILKNFVGNADRERESLAHELMHMIIRKRSQTDFEHRIWQADSQQGDWNITSSNVCSANTPSCAARALLTRTGTSSTSVAQIEEVQWAPVHYPPPPADPACPLSCQEE